MATWFGYGPPFLGGAENILSRQEDEQLIKNDLKSLLLTVPGERYNRPDFGCQLRNFTFELADDSQLSSLRQSVINAIEQWEERVIINNVDVGSSQDHQLTVTVNVSPVNNPLVNYLIAINISPTGAIS